MSKRYHCPAFDLNIIEADILIQRIKETFGKELVYCQVRYEPPYLISITFSFKTEETKFIIRIIWEANTEADYFRLTDHIWEIGPFFIESLDKAKSKTNADVDRQNKLTSDYILKFIGECLG